MKTHIHMWSYLAQFFLEWEIFQTNIVQNIIKTPILHLIVTLWARSKKCEKRLLASSRLSFRVEQLGSHWADFHEILNLNIFRKYVEKIKVSLKPNKNNGYFTWRAVYIYNRISLSSY